MLSDEFFLHHRNAVVIAEFEGIALRQGHSVLCILVEDLLLIVIEELGGNNDGNFAAIMREIGSNNERNLV